jgi:hypothetical protein
MSDARLQDQYLTSPANGSLTRALRAIVEGDAGDCHAHESTVLSEEARAEKAHSDTAERDQYEATLGSSNVPSVLSTAFELPYALGPQFVEIAYVQGGNKAVDALIRQPPSTEVQLLDPLRSTSTNPVPAVDPLLPPGAEALDRSPMGAGFLFVFLGEHMEPAAAFDAAVTWAGEASVTWRQNGRICVDADIRTNANGRGALLAGMMAWAEAMPEQAGATDRRRRRRAHPWLRSRCRRDLAVPARTEQTSRTRPFVRDRARAVA